jgi:hypothetical protein
MQSRSLENPASADRGFSANLASGFSTAVNTLTDAVIDRRNFLIAAAGLAAAGGAADSLAQQKLTEQESVDLALALAADCSGSIKPEHYVLQQQGYADAFSHKDVIKAIRSGARGQIAVCYFQWSGYSLQGVNIPWTILSSDDSIARFVAALRETERSIFSGGTAPAGAIAFGQKLLGELPVKAERKVIDISGDGRTNTGPPPDEDRANALAAGITINGLPILHLEPDIDEYYEKYLIGGPGAFIVSARDFDSFKDAIRRKLVLEIAGLTPDAPKRT